jgi:predicted ArsR family transcriptional regulator
MPVSIDPKDQLIWDYIKKRMSPVTIKHIMKTLLVSEAHARRALDYFVTKGLIDMTKQGRTRFYKAKE